MPTNIRFKIIIFIVSLTFIASGCATTARRPVISSGKEVYLKDICKQNNIYWQWDAVSQVATLEYGGIKAEVLVGSDLVIVDKDRISLSSPVRMAKSAVIVPMDFRSKVISRLRRQAVEDKGYGVTPIREIIIDAGHGGKDPGAIGRRNIQEKRIVLDVSQRLAKILKERGYKVKMTRSSDVFISLQERTEIASRSNADLFVSVHANASPVRSVHGLEVFTSKQLRFQDKAEVQRKTNQQLMFANMSMKKGSNDLMNIVSDMLYTHKQGAAKTLAKQLSKKTSRAVKTKNRGEKQSRFYVLRNTLIPAVLVEVGFLTNPKESKLLQTGTYRQRIARGIAESIIDYANGQ
jgi:N-acetylmuramoyl-L-alanine amidase